MRLDVLGCCGSYLIARRVCSGYLVSSGDDRVWVDTGTGTLERLLGHVDLWDLDAIWISHLHADHWSDLPAALQRMKLTRPSRAGPIPVYGPAGWTEDTGLTTRDRLGEEDPVLTPHLLENNVTYEVGELRLEAVAMEHSKPTFGVRISDGQRTVGYTADTVTSPAATRVAEDTDLFLCEAGSTPGEEEPVHLTPRQAAEHAREGRTRHLVLTHLPPAADAARWHRAAAEVFDGPIDVAVDGASFSL